MQNYPDGGARVAGFVDWRLIQALQWDHIYTANYFLALMALLAASLAACTSTRQLPAVRIARRHGPCSAACQHARMHLPLCCSLVHAAGASA
jgi:cytochrome c biogenesis protein ResB